VIFVDESHFSLNTTINKGFALIENNCHQPKITKVPTTIHLIAGIGLKYGLEGFILTTESINSQVFLSVLEEFDRNGTDYSLFGDNASIHISTQCMTKYFNKGVFFIKNVLYSPTLNPIENYFGILKSHYKRL
jgi:hypothetical protein